MDNIGLPTGRELGLPADCLAWNVESAYLAGRNNGLRYCARIVRSLLSYSPRGPELIQYALGFGTSEHQAKINALRDYQDRMIANGYWPETRNMGKNL